MDTMGSDVPDAADATPDCTLQLFRDQDGDGYGALGEVRCPTEGWVTEGGDCLDDPAAEHAVEVHPGQLDFFTEGYSRPDQPGVISFDYDCSGDEEPAPDNRPDRAAGDCNSASPICGGFGGVLPAEPSRGATVNALCGSTTALVCNEMMGNQCEGAEQPLARAFRCH